MYLGGNVEYDDMVSYGVFGLIDAIDKFDTNKDVKFETYASLRIRGSILDQIRKMDWIRHEYKFHKRVSEQGAEPVMDARRNSHFISRKIMVEEEELKQKLEESLEVLTEKERKVILLYYYEI